MTSLKSWFGSVLCWGHQNVECCAEMASELILLLSTGAVCCLCRLCRGETQSCCANLVTSEITTTVVWLTGKITLEKDSAKAPNKVGLYIYGWINDEEKPCDGIIVMRTSWIFSFCHFLKRYSPSLFLVFWKSTFTSSGYTLQFHLLNNRLFFSSC